MMERTLRLRKGVNRFIQLADDSDEVPNLQGKTYGVFKLSAAEWTKLELMRDVLQVCASFLFLIFVFYYTTRSLQTRNNHFLQHVNLPYGALFRSSNSSKRRGKTWPAIQSSTTFQMPFNLASIIYTNGTTRLTRVTSTLFASVCVVFTMMMSPLMYPVVLALDPNYKVAYAKSKWERDDFNAGMKCLKNVVSPCLPYVRLQVC
jgi:hypothetical protein